MSLGPFWAFSGLFQAFFGFIQAFFGLFLLSLGYIIAGWHQKSSSSHIVGKKSAKIGFRGLVYKNANRWQFIYIL